MATTSPSPRTSQSSQRHTAPPTEFNPQNQQDRVVPLLASEATVVHGPDIDFDDEDEAWLDDLELDANRILESLRCPPVPVRVPSPDPDPSPPPPVAPPLPSHVSPTLLSSLLWCEYQTLYSLTTPTPRPQTASMSAGNAIHSKLEKETLDRAGVITVDVDLRDKDGRVSREDVWAVRWWNAAVALGALMDEGVAREIPVLSFIPLSPPRVDSNQNPPSTPPHPPTRTHVPIYGVVDQIARRELPSGDWEYVISDTKTVSRVPHLNAFPTESAALTPHTAQMSLYKVMWDSMVMRPADELAQLMMDFCADALRLSVDKPLGKGVLAIVGGWARGADEVGGGRVGIGEDEDHAEPASSQTSQCSHATEQSEVWGGVSSVCPSDTEAASDRPPWPLSQAGATLDAPSQRDAHRPSQPPPLFQAGSHDRTTSQPTHLSQPTPPTTRTTTLRHLLSRVAQAYTLFPPASSSLELHYLPRTNPDAAPTVVSFTYVGMNVDAFILGAMSVLRGLVQPAGVPVAEAGKCRVCEFADECEWRWRKAREARDGRSGGRSGGSSGSQNGSGSGTPNASYGGKSLEW